jgi:hypothetical protein
MVDRGRLLPASDVFMDTHFGVLFFLVLASCYVMYVMLLLHSKAKRWNMILFDSCPLVLFGGIKSMNTYIYI